MTGAFALGGGQKFLPFFKVMKYNVSNKLEGWRYEYAKNNSNRTGIDLSVWNDWLYDIGF